MTLEKSEGFYAWIVTQALVVFMMIRSYSNLRSNTSRTTTKPPLESRVVKAIKAKLESRGGFWVKIHGSPMQVSGVPDLLGCYRGYFLGLEVKRSADEKATPLQKYNMERIRAAGGIAALIHSVPQAEAVLDWIDRREARRSSSGKPPGSTTR
jgi:hypothetical protein